MSENLDVIEQLIRYCPVCGHASKKPFDIISVYGGSWVCEMCEEGIEVNFIAYEEIVDDEEEATEDDQENRVSHLLIIILILIFVVYLTTKM